MSEEPRPSDDPFLPLLVAFDEELAAGRETPPAVPPELTERFEAAAVGVATAGAGLAAGGRRHDRRSSAGAGGRRRKEGTRPSLLGKFDVLGELGRGGFGVVYLARDTELGRRVALKTPRWDRWLTSELRQRFLQEGRAAAAPEHPNIVPVYEAGEAGPLCYIASAYCEGGSLAAWLAAANAAGPLPPGRGLRGRPRRGRPARPRPRRRPPRPQAVEHLVARRRRGRREHGVLYAENRRFRTGEVGRRGGDGNAERRRHGYARLHGPRTGRRACERDRPGRGHLWPRRGVVRNVDRRPIPGVFSRGDAAPVARFGVPQAAPASTQGRAARPARDHLDLSGKGSDPPIRHAAALETDLRRWLDGKAPLGRPEPLGRRVGRWAARAQNADGRRAAAGAAGVGGLIGRPLLIDPDRPAKTATARLVGGDQVELIGEKGRPVWSRWRTARKGADGDRRRRRPSGSTAPGSVSWSCSPIRGGRRSAYAPGCVTTAAPTPLRRSASSSRARNIRRLAAPSRFWGCLPSTSIRSAAVAGQTPCLSTRKRSACAPASGPTRSTAPTGTCGAPASVRRCLRPWAYNAPPWRSPVADVHARRRIGVLGRRRSPSDERRRRPSGANRSPRPSGSGGDPAGRPNSTWVQTDFTPGGAPGLYVERSSASFRDVLVGPIP